MIILYFAVISIIVALVRGGKIKRLGELQIRQIWLIYIPPTIIASFVIARKLGYGDLVHATSGWLHLFSYCTLFIFVGLNRRLTGVWLLAAGLSLNMLVLVANHGLMPVSYNAAQLARMSPKALRIFRGDTMSRHVLLSEKTRLSFLSDVIAVPSPPFPSGEVISPGDVVLAFGVFILIQAAILPIKRKSAADSKT